MREVEDARGALPAGEDEVLVEAWTDGAALHPAVRQLSRAGWGLWIPGRPGGEVAEPLRGGVQTAQRAELRAFVAALEATRGVVKVWTDSRFVCRGARYLAAGTVPNFAHRDLWARAAEAWRPGVSEVCWIKAHLEWEEAEARGFPRHAW